MIHAFVQVNYALSFKTKNGNLNSEMPQGKYKILKLIIEDL